MALDEYLGATRDHFASYHHHKERMAHAAVILYLASVTALAVKTTSVWQPAASKSLLALLLLTIAAIAFSFVVWQLRNREFAADLVKACGNLLTLSMAAKLINPDLTPTWHGEHQFPAVLVEQLRQIAQRRGLLDGPRFIEVVTYVVMAAWTAGALIRVANAA